MRPRIQVDSDYEHRLEIDVEGRTKLVGGYFETLVRGWITEAESAGHEFKHGCVRITAGPWRPYAVGYEVEGNVLHLDFYSALRTGFGSIAASEVAAIKELL